MDYEDNPVSPDEFDHDLHALNQEIIRLAFVLNIDLADEAIIDEIMSDSSLESSKDTRSKELLTLKGLLVLRGQLRKERLDSGLTDGISPLNEPAFKALKPKKKS